MTAPVPPPAGPPPPAGADFRAAAGFILAMASLDGEACVSPLMGAWTVIERGGREVQTVAALGTLLRRLIREFGGRPGPDLDLSPPEHRGPIAHIRDLCDGLTSGEMGLADVAAEDWLPLAAYQAKALLAYGPQAVRDLREVLTDPGWPQFDPAVAAARWYGVSPS